MGGGGGGGGCVYWSGSGAGEERLETVGGQTGSCGLRDCGWRGREREREPGGVRGQSGTRALREQCRKQKKEDEECCLRKEKEEVRMFVSLYLCINVSTCERGQSTTIHPFTPLSLSITTKYHVHIPLSG